MVVRLEIIVFPGGWADGDACAPRLDTWTGGALIELFFAANLSRLPYYAIPSAQESIMEAPDCPAAMRDGVEYNATKTGTFRNAKWRTVQWVSREARPTAHPHGAQLKQLFDGAACFVERSDMGQRACRVQVRGGMDHRVVRAQSESSFGILFRRLVVTGKVSDDGASAEGKSGIGFERDRAIKPRDRCREVRVEVTQGERRLRKHDAIIGFKTNGADVDGSANRRPGNQRKVGRTGGDPVAGQSCRFRQADCR